MINRCPHCGFEPIKDQLVCPNCGKEIKENIAEKLRIDNKEVIHLEEDTTEKNDNIVWSDLQEVPIGTLMEHMSGDSELEDEADEVKPVNESIEDATDSNHLVTDSDLHQRQTEEASIETDAEADTTEGIDEVASTNESDDNVDYADDDAPNPILAEYLQKHNARKLAEQQALADEKSAIATEEASSVEDKTVMADKQEAQTVITATDAIDEKHIAEATSADSSLTINQAKDRTNFDPDYLIDSNDVKEQADTPQANIDAALTQISKLNTTQVEENPIPATANEDLEIAEEQQLETTGKNKKWRSVALAAALLLAVGTGYWYAHQQRSNTSDEKVLEQVDQQVAKLSSKIDDLYTTKQRNFIKSTVTLAQINQLAKQLANFDGQENYKKLKTRLEAAKEQLLAEQDINGYFTKAILANGKLNHEAHIDYAKKFDLQLRKGKTAFDQLANLAIKQGQDEYKNYEAAKKAVDELMAGYKNQLLASSVTREKYQQAKKLVDQLFTSTQKTAMTEQLQTIDKALTKQENEQKQAQQANTTNQGTNAATDSTNTSATSANNQTSSSNNTSGSATISAENAYNTQPVYASWLSEETQVLTPQTTHQVNNQPIIATRLSDLQDVNNPAWTWAPGIKEKVLQACIDRGYVVPGGYVLERVRIENGEGYYNLYSISPSAKFSASPDKPMYVVTINCKTGFYKGNGNDHTIR
ncbi:cell division site-positioning protein MapZ family protein [Enterococcus columbae]|uniref:Uncharacterized protein n=1 Tax=Enterococcus columbae DSM 7374 = ATCC 51263 TaxID=1121865 RepID=S0KTD6_9ENTE|nr:cell division site-positioning protein MapZ family protein [Enterococcus columbae]EOT42501.1 hypothetical protein OMW_00979 [Enterococcus columbae DSM 7374 = ATCC 51263]EOW87563.1 hypothetical protein I568_00228 [Enterococcus columbae DSM 7374 = ATCC 51263]OJG23117.1 hypothetical protein RR47_GL000607 [Enterococcus columbae DSM 7374 = ATCC 51263]